MIITPNFNEEQLWKSFLEGNNDSLEKIYRIYFDELYQYGNKWLNDSNLTEDVIQDLFIKLMRTRQNLSQTSSIKFYLFRSFKSIALDKIKAEKNTILLDDYDEKLFQIHLNPENVLIDKQDYHLIREKLNVAISKLTPRQREALFLRYNKGFSYPEVAEMMELTIKGTYKLMARTIEALKISLASIVCFGCPLDKLMTTIH
ncbi:MAG: sigma-70 family RNA polymerase sigma factor [Ginsengibacter sp.]